VVERLPVFLDENSGPGFPDPEDYDDEGLVAVGGDLTPARLLDAYGSGLFPWYDEGYVPMWWSPNPRANFDPDHLHVSRSLAKTLRRHEFRLTWNTCFERIMRTCGEQRDGGTWIIPEMIAAYTELHRMGHAHSLEVWVGDELVGGTYGVQVGGLFAAESKFHRRTDMSKVAVVAMVRSLFRKGISLLDVQMPTEHLASLGMQPCSRRDYLNKLIAAKELIIDLTDLTPSV
jgi:leucyl/phenylalanyl-tRNA--protein transferase